MRTFRCLRVLILGLLATGCGVSPLLNHVNAEELAAAAASPAEPCQFRFPIAGLCASLEWEVIPGDQFGEFLLRFWDEARSGAKGPYVDPGSSIAAMLWMPSMNHGSRRSIVITRLDQGVYRATRADFSMPGHWEIWVQLKDGAVIVEKAALNYQAP